MSTEQENTEGIPFETLFPHFKRYKVAISQAIKKPFPFLAFLRDNELISDKMYQDFQDSCTNLVPVEQVVYRALEELEKRLDLVVLGVLFSEENVKAYPDLEHILQSFQSVLQNKLCSQGSDRGDPNSQLSLDQVLSLPENEFSEDLYGKEQTDQGRRDTTGDNTDGLERDQAAMRQGPDSEPEESCELEVHQSNSDAPMEPHSPQPWDEERPQLRTQGTQVYPGSMNLGDIKQENSSFVLNGEETQASSSHNQASEAMDLSIEDSDGGINCSEESTSGICQSAGVLSHGTQITPCSVRLVDIMQGNSSFAPDGEETESRTSYDQASEIIDLSIEDSDDGINYLEESTSGTCQSDIMQENSSFVSDGEETESRTSYDQASETIDLSIEDSDDGINYLEESTSDICQSSPRIRRQFNVNFVCPELPVTCGTAKGTLYKEKFEQGIHAKSIRSETGRWFTPMKFEIKGNRGDSKNWRQSIRCYGWPLKELIEDGYLPDPPRKRGKKGNPPNRQRTRKKLENSKQCTVCGQRRRLYQCAICSKFYHKRCHIPPVEVKSGLWNCVFCMTKDQLRCQENRAHHKESEVLRREMLPEEQLKCELLLLTIYCHSKSRFFIPKPKQRKEDFPDLQEHMWLNKIKYRLNKKAYHSVQHFVKDMRLIFRNHSIFYNNHKFSYLGVTVGELFEKTFKRIFSIKDASK